MPQVGDRAGRILREHFLEGLLRRGILERVQHRHAAQELLLHRRAARVRKSTLPSLSLDCACAKAERLSIR